MGNVLKQLRQHIAERLHQHRNNVDLWMTGALTPTEPDPTERAAVVRELKAAIAELEKVSELVGMPRDESDLARMVREYHERQP